MLKDAIRYKMPENARPVQSEGRRPPPEPEPIELAILHEDEWLIAIAKPPGMVVHPTYRNWSGTLLNGLLWHVRGRTGLEPRIVTRLDKDTSGIVLVALNADVHAQIQRDTAGQRVRKEYLAVVLGTPTPANGTIALPLARSIFDRRRVVVDPFGQESETRYAVMSRHVVKGQSEGRPLHDSTDVSLVRCELVTGRTHQIRVHLAARGWPVLGDPVYGEPHPAISRQALHAWRASMPHPATRLPLTIEAAVPSDLQPLIDQNLTL